MNVRATIIIVVKNKYFCNENQEQYFSLKFFVSFLSHEYRVQKSSAVFEFSLNNCYQREQKYWISSYPAYAIFEMIFRGQMDSLNNN